MKTTCGYPGCGLDTGSRPYARSGIPSVTTVIDLSNFDDKGRRMSWSAAGHAAKTAVHWSQDWVDKGTHVRITEKLMETKPPEVLAAVGDVMDCTQDHKIWPGFCPSCKYLRSQFDRDSSKKKHLGSHLHHLALSWAQVEQIESDDTLDPYLDGLEAWYELYRPTWQHLERTIYYERGPRQYVGTFDAMAEINCPVCIDREGLVLRCNWLLDIKSGIGIWVKEFALQLAAYRYADSLTVWEKGKQRVDSKMPTVAHTGIIWLRDTGQAELVPIDTTAEEHNQFLRLLDVWAWSRRVDKEAAELALPVAEEELEDATV
jgi:hypothetical protein